MRMLINKTLLIVAFVLTMLQSVHAQVSATDKQLNTRAPDSAAPSGSGASTGLPNLEDEKPILMSPTKVQGRRYDASQKRLINMIAIPPLESLGDGLPKVKGRKRFVWESTGRGFRYRFLWREH
jgi:hypothetical protein